MEFPPVERVLYDHNPLAEVVCQIRFPRILAVDEGVPANFQRALGNQYPFVETQEIARFSVSLGVPSPAPSASTQYIFRTEDGAYKITLWSEAVAISTERYVSWEEFFPHVVSALDALTQSYSVSLFTRIGLRYVDLISRKALGLSEMLWGDLIRQSALGLLAESAIPISEVAELSAVTALKLDDGAICVVRTGLGRAEKTGEEQIFAVDSDFYKEGPIKGVDDAADICGKFNTAAGRAFRWFIRDPLHQALGPRVPG